MRSGGWGLGVGGWAGEGQRIPHAALHTPYRAGSHILKQGQDVERDPLERGQVELAEQVGEVVGGEGENEAGDERAGPRSGQVADQPVGAEPAATKLSDHHQVVDGQ